MARRPQTTRRPQTPRGPPARFWTPEALASLLEHPLLPAWWVALLVCAAREAWQLPTLWGAELFAGKAELSQAFRRMVGPFASYDILIDGSHDLLTQAGLLEAMKILLRICARGLLWLGTPCQSWIGLSRSFTRRSRIQPEGPPPSRCSSTLSAYLKTHNELAHRSALFIITANLLKIFIAIEQPTSSLLFEYAPMKNALRCAMAQPIAMMMQWFDGATPKPLRIFSNAPCIDGLKKKIAARRMKASKCTSRLANTDCKGGFTGKARELKESSGYTRSFGEAWAASFLTAFEDEDADQPAVIRKRPAGRAP